MIYMQSNREYLHVSHQDRAVYLYESCSTDRQKALTPTVITFPFITANVISPPQSQRHSHRKRVSRL